MLGSLAEFVRCWFAECEVVLDNHEMAAAGTDRDAQRHRPKLRRIIDRLDRINHGVTAGARCFYLDNFRHWEPPCPPRACSVECCLRLASGRADFLGKPRARARRGFSSEAIRKRDTQPPGPPNRAPRTRRWQHPRWRRPSGGRRRRPLGRLRLDHSSARTFRWHRSLVASSYADQDARSTTTLGADHAWRAAISSRLLVSFIAKKARMSLGKLLPGEAARDDGR
jgi:hypothetical protein